MTAQLREAERRMRVAENEADQMRETVESLQTIRRQLEAERDELEEKAAKVTLQDLSNRNN